MAAFLTLQISMKASKEVSKCTNRCFMSSQLSVFCLDTKRELAHFETYSLLFNSVTKYLCRTEYRRVISFHKDGWHRGKTPRRINTLSAKLESNQGSSAPQSDVLTATPRILSNFWKFQNMQDWSKYCCQTF